MPPTVRSGLRLRSPALWLLSPILLAPLLTGCDINTPTYFPGGQVLEVGGTAPDGTPRPGGATDNFTLAFRAPNADEQGALAAEAARLGFVTPWLRRSDIAIEISYTITNLDDQPGTAQVIVDGADEFTNYDSAAIQAYLDMALAGMDNETVVLPLVQGAPVMLSPHQVVQGLVREDDLAEAELDLDAIGRWMAPAAAVLINRSEVNAVGLDMVPAAEVVPALFRLAITFSASTHMSFQYVVRVRDGAGRLYEGSGTPFAPTPMDFMPVIQ